MGGDISANLTKVRQAISDAEEAAGRPNGSVQLVAVTKTHPVHVIQEAIDAGQWIFGENRVQEARAKIPELPSRVQWHLVGHLQSNKVRIALPLFELIHGVDSVELLADIDRVASELGLFPRVLLQVNVAGEASKFGFPPTKLLEQIEIITQFKRPNIEGLMTIPPLAPTAEHSRPYFVALRELRDRLARESGFPLPELSMGMSGDYRVAIAEGATMVRIGTAIFGERGSR
ncbi:MAG TPA: YggS family pyridoxal phosphate-dependent enzyme [Chthoniobacterales bacterium]|nr:YggS family pyridoxal phosphate-dependent enzyme [Chthoniobacterales bacterium]